MKRAEQVEQLRGERAETLAQPHQTPELIEQQAAEQIKTIEQRAKKEISLIDRAIAEVKEKYEQAKQFVREKFDGWRVKNTPDVSVQVPTESPPKTETFVEKFRREQAEQIEKRRQDREQNNQTHKPRHTQ